MNSTQELKIWGPNVTFKDGGVLHVHAAGCRDLKRAPYNRLQEGGDQGGYLERHWSVRGLVEDYYSNMIAESEEGITWEDYVGEFHIFPCVTLPYQTSEEAQA